MFSSAAEFIENESETADPATTSSTAVAAPTVGNGNFPGKKSADSSDYFCKTCDRALGRYVDTAFYLHFLKTLI